ncbi:hypothetical protein F2Q69_00043035 [Brassica cretica]|uniref:Uncharacterized protein n=1 Tax=Brassica cretica TaxID=69181 RepID=A0A8S9N4P3_BRACR|nr:hypothetical protein F2Q69_00043035 [Brassica cretica]
MPLWSGALIKSHCNIDRQFSSEIDRRSARRIGRQSSKQLGKRLLQSHNGGTDQIHHAQGGNVPSIDRNTSTSIDTHLHQTSRKRASTDIAYYPSIDTNVDCEREGDPSIGSWADDCYHESYAVETAICDPGADELLEDFTYEELLNMQKRNEVDQQRAEASGERTHFSHPIDRANNKSIDDKHP